MDTPPLSRFCKILMGISGFGSFHVICKALLLAFRTSHIISIVGSNHELFCMVSTHESQGLSHYVVEFEMQKFEEVKVRILSIQSH